MEGGREEAAGEAMEITVNILISSILTYLGMSLFFKFFVLTRTSPCELAMMKKDDVYY